jgi:dienelactone hydrolase
MCKHLVVVIVGALPPTDAPSTDYRREGYSSADVLDAGADSDAPVIHFCTTAGDDTRTERTARVTDHSHRGPLARSGVRLTVPAIDSLAMRGGTIQIRTDSVTLDGELLVPEETSGVVAFAHGSGSSRFSPRNNAVAERLRDRGLGTLLFDLLTEAEDRDYETRFDVDLLTGRLLGATDWLRDQSETADLRVGYFGSSTGAAAALRAAAARDDVDAVVSRGGRVDLAGDALADVGAPTLLLVGERDEAVLSLNRRAFDRLTCEKEFTVVEGASHLFEEPGKLEVVADAAADWFVDYLDTRL